MNVSPEYAEPLRYAKHLGVEIGDYGATFSWKDELPKGTGMTAWNPFPMDTTYFGEGNQAVMINYRVDDLTRSWWISPPPASGSTRNARTRAMVASPGSRTATGTGWSSGSRSRASSLPKGGRASKDWSANLPRNRRVTEVARAVVHTSTATTGERVGRVAEWFLLRMHYGLFDQRKRSMRSDWARNPENLMHWSAGHALARLEMSSGSQGRKPWRSVARY